MDPEQSDTGAVAHLLEKALGEATGSFEGNFNFSVVTLALSVIEGPYAFIYYHASSGSLIYGRDPFGRRSLVAAKPVVSADLKSNYIDEEEDDDPFYADMLILSSVNPGEGFVCKEVPVGGIFVTELHVRGGTVRKHIEVPWPETRLKLERLIDAKERVKGSTDLLIVMHQALGRRIARIGEGEKTKIGILFSGGIDSVVLAALLHRALEEKGMEQAIELINVAFVGNDDSPTAIAPDRLAAIASYVDLKELFPSRQWVLIEVDISSKDRREAEKQVLNLILPRDTHMDLNIGTVFWFASKAQGHVKKVDYSDDDRDSVLNSSIDGRPLLRRGGADAAQSVGREEWINKNSAERTEAQRCSNADCGRVSKGRCVNSCCAKCCLKIQNRAGSTCVAHSNHFGRDYQVFEEEVDPSSRTEDALRSEFEPRQATSRILLVGIGADEQLGGYGRHRTTFMKGGASALAAELNKDLGRLWMRNLGRDDRCITDHGREAWFPFLDEQVVRFFQELPLSDVLDLSRPPGEGDKAVLRDVAARLGLKSCSNLVKRAVQFGTRIAKDTNKQHMGSNRKGKGTLKVHL